jgi:excisionase family DNA binding protein
MTIRDGWTTTGAYSRSDEVATYLDMEVSTIRHYARTGVIPAIKIGGELRFRKLDVEKWASRQPKASA